MPGKLVIIAFVPVLHEGYRQFFEKYTDAETMFIFGKDVIEKEFPHLQKEIRALDPEIMKAAIQSLSLFKNIEILSLGKLEKLSQEKIEIVLPDEDVSHVLAEKYFKDKKVTFDKVFLRWDKHKSMEEKHVETNQKISKEEFDRAIIRDLQMEAEKSSDWWRHVGAAVIKDDKVISVTHNKHLPSEHSPYSDGDPRNNFHKGIGIELSTVLHAEAALISGAARRGESLEGASMYVTVFPCPPCAKLVANAGIKKLYYAGGYALLGQDNLLQNMGVEIVYVDMESKNGV